eukprot:PhF_6_TR38900/c0_g1_i2/m.58187
MACTFLSWSIAFCCGGFVIVMPTTRKEWVMVGHILAALVGVGVVWYHMYLHPCQSRFLDFEGKAIGASVWWCFLGLTFMTIELFRAKINKNNMILKKKI